VISLLLAVVVAQLPVDVEISRRRVDAADGVPLALYRYDPPGHGVAHAAVLLVADFGFGRSLFDFEGRGLARWLSERGVRVYVGEVRGQGASGGGASLPAIAERDLPALFAAVASENAWPFDLVVQGWVGTLALTVATPAQVRRVVAVNTPVEFAVPASGVEHWLFGGGRFSALAPGEFDALFALKALLPERTGAAFQATGTRDLSAALALQWLGWMRTGDLPLAHGTVESALSRYDRPTLQVLALADGVAPPELASPLRELTRAPTELVTLTHFTRSEDGSHLSVFLGREVETELFPRIERFLEAR
jgi:predicted alpha/beta hydrolase